MKKTLYTLLIYTTMASHGVGQPNDLSLTWETSTEYIFLNQLEDAIVSNIDTLNNIAGLLICKNGKIIIENYYNGSYQDEIFPIFSATKSFISTIVGQAYGMGMIPDPNLPLSNFLSEDIAYLDEISLSNLLSMTSGYLPLDNYLNATTYDLANAPYSDGPGSFLYQN